MRSAVYVLLAGFCLAWILGPSGLRSLVPIWLAFGIALALELAFFAGALRPGPVRQPDRGPQQRDRAQLGYPPDDDADEGAHEPPPGRVGGLLAGLGVIAALAALVWLADRGTGWDGLDRDTQLATMAQLSAEASRIAAKPVTVRCDVAGEFVGVVQHADGAAAVGGDTAYLTPAICHTLQQLISEGEVTASRTGRALAVLAHEAWHLRGVADEGETECNGLQSGVELGRRLGLSEGRARQLMRQQLTENALRGGAGLEYRVPPECRNGGSLDLAPSDPSFP